MKLHKFTGNRLPDYNLTPPDYWENDESELVKCPYCEEMFEELVESDMYDEKVCEECSVLSTCCGVAVDDAGRCSECKEGCR